MVAAGGSGGGGGGDGDGGGGGGGRFLVVLFAGCLTYARNLRNGSAQTAALAVLLRWKLGKLVTSPAHSVIQ